MILNFVSGFSLCKSSSAYNGLVVQLVEHGTYALSSFAYAVDGGYKGNGSRAVLPLTRRQCSSHCKAAARPTA